MMMTITEKIANLKGYLEGVQLDENKQETKIIEKIVLRVRHVLQRVGGKLLARFIPLF